MMISDNYSFAHFVNTVIGKDHLDIESRPCRQTAPDETFSVWPSVVIRIPGEMFR